MNSDRREKKKILRMIRLNGKISNYVICFLLNILIDCCWKKIQLKFKSLLTITFSRNVRNWDPFIHHVILADGFEPIAWHSMSYVRSADNGWLFKRISTDSGRTAIRSLFVNVLLTTIETHVIFSNEHNTNIFEQRNSRKKHYHIECCFYCVVSIQTKWYNAEETKKKPLWNKCSSALLLMTNEWIQNTIMIK